MRATTELRKKTPAVSATPFTAPILEKRGFAEVEKPDFSALARNEPIATHCARLPAACVAYSYLASNPGGTVDTADNQATDSSPKAPKAE